MPRHLFLRVLALLLVFALVAAACGDDDESDTGTEAPADDAGAEEPEPEGSEDSEADEPADDGAADDGAAAADDSEDAAACDATVPGTQIDYGTFAPNRASM